MTNYSVFTLPGTRSSGTGSTQQFMHGSPIRLGLICTVNVSSWPRHRSDKNGFPAENLPAENFPVEKFRWKNFPQEFCFRRKIFTGNYACRGISGSFFHQKKITGKKKSGNFPPETEFAVETLGERLNSFMVIIYSVLLFPQTPINSA